MGKYVKKSDRIKKELSQLDKDCIEAKKLGLTYGQYKGMGYSKWVGRYVKQYNKMHNVNIVER